MHRDYYWDEVSEEIGRILLRELKREMKICEIGFSSGHFLEWLFENGYCNLTGIEVRREQYEVIRSKFVDKQLPITLIEGDVMSCTKLYDAVFSTGLIQCISVGERKCFLKHISDMAPVAIFTVPKIEKQRNVNSLIPIGVTGCVEYETGNLSYELSEFYERVHVGEFECGTEDDKEIFVYYICRRV